MHPVGLSPEAEQKSAGEVPHTAAGQIYGAKACLALVKARRHPTGPPPEMQTSK
jgi:hypothetical protein